MNSPSTDQGPNGTIRALETACASIEVRMAGPWHRAAGGLLLLPLLLIVSSRVIDRPAGSAGEFDKVLLKTCFGVLLLTWVRGLALIYAIFVHDRYSDVATYFMIKGSIRSADDPGAADSLRRT
jgi:hypothetical protein